MKYTFKNRVCYYKGDVLHNPDGPAVIFNGGEERYYIDGKLHREDGPAVVFNDYHAYYIEGTLHRLNGPAIEYLNDKTKNKYVIDGIEYSEHDFIVISRNIKLKGL